jgi:hypothetical protein
MLFYVEGGALNVKFLCDDVSYLLVQAIRGLVFLLAIKLILQH